MELLSSEMPESDEGFDIAFSEHLPIEIDDVDNSSDRLKPRREKWLPSFDEPSDDRYDPYEDRRGHSVLGFDPRTERVRDSLIRPDRGRVRSLPQFDGPMDDRYGEHSYTTPYLELFGPPSREELGQHTSDQYSDADEDDSSDDAAPGSESYDSDGRLIREHRRVRWEVMLGVGLVAPNEPSKDDFLAGSMEMSNAAYAACLTEKPTAAAIQYEKDKACEALLEREDDEGPPLQKRVLRVVNGSLRSSCSGTSKETVKESGGGLTTSTEQIPSGSMNENIVPMSHWQAEARRIGMPLTGYPTNPIADYHYQDHQMEAIRSGLQAADVSRATSCVDENLVDQESSEQPKSRRPSVKDFIKQTFSRSPKKTGSTGSYFNRLFTRTKSSDGQVESAAGVEPGEHGADTEGIDFTCNVKPIQDEDEEGEPHSHPLQSHPVFFNEPMFARRQNEAGESREGSRHGSPSTKQPKTFRGQVEGYD